MEKMLQLILDKLGELEKDVQAMKDHLEKLNDRVTLIESTMATKADIANMATKDDIADMATKADIADMATKADIANMATKADIADLATKAEVADIPAIKVAVLETREKVGMIQEDQRSIHELLGDHEISIRTLRRRYI
jgi:hypothetical protein